MHFYSVVCYTVVEKGMDQNLNEKSVFKEKLHNTTWNICISWVIFQPFNAWAAYHIRAEKLCDVCPAQIYDMGHVMRKRVFEQCAPR